MSWGGGGLKEDLIIYLFQSKCLNFKHFSKKSIILKSKWGKLLDFEGVACIPVIFSTLESYCNKLGG